METLKAIGTSIVTWSWTKRLLSWIILSAGTMSECVFLVASIWMSINSSVHSFILLFMSEQASTHITQLATSAYVALPELILGLACVTVIGHVKLWFYSKRTNTTALIWSILFVIPTLVFLILSVITLAWSVMTTNFILPMPLVVSRAIAGYMFAFTSLLYTSLGKPQEKERLQEKDAFIQRLSEQIDHQEAEAENLKALLEESINAQVISHKSVDKLSDDALQAYSQECNDWLRSGVKTVSVDEITRFTGHNKRKIDNAKLQRSPRNKELILVSSLVEWLRQTLPPQPLKTEPELSQETGPKLHIVNE